MGIYSYRPYEASDVYNVGAYGSSGARTPESQVNANTYANPNSPRSASTNSGSGSSGNAPHQAFGDMAQHWATTLKGYMQPAPASASAPPQPDPVSAPSSVPSERTGQWSGWSGFGGLPSSSSSPPSSPPLPSEEAKRAIELNRSRELVNANLAMGQTTQPAPAPASVLAPAPPVDAESIQSLAPQGTGSGNPMPVSAMPVRALSTNGGDTPADRTDGSTPDSSGQQPAAGTPYSASNPPPKPSDADMADSEKAAAWYRKFSYVNPAFANITAADVAAYRGNSQGMSIGDWYLAGNGSNSSGNGNGNGNGNNGNGNAGPDPAPDGGPPAGTTGPPALTKTNVPYPEYSDANPPPKPANTEDPEIAADWYRKFAYKNSAFANITSADVTNQRMLATSGKFAAMGHPEWQDFATWYAAGMPGGQYDAGTDNGGGTNGNGGNGTGSNNGGGNGTTTTTPATTSTTATTTSSSSSAPDPWAFNGPPDPSMSNDIAKTIHDRFAPLWGQERTDYSREMNAQAALTGDMNSGGYGETFGRGMSRLMGQESGQEAQFIQQANENTLNRNMELYGIKSNAQLQTFLAKNQDLLERYKAQLNLKGVEYSADRGVDAAALHAAAASAAAAAGLEGAKYAATLDANTRDLLSQRQYDLGIYGLNQDTYKAQLEDRYKQQYLQWIMSPEYRLSQPPLVFPGNVGVP